MLISLTVGKVDAGVAVLLTEDKRLIEFPSILLPPSISSGSIVDIAVSRNLTSENAAQKAFDDLQTSIYTTYGLTSPSTPILRCRNATQTSVVLEWDPIALATAELRSLSLYRNGNKAGSIPRPMEITSTKISGLAIDTEYTFHLVLRTSAGIYSSEKLVIKTHQMTNLTGITVTPGVLPAPLRHSLTDAVERIGGKMADSVRIDTTHFVCTEGRGREWERAVEMNIPVVRPEWIEGCEREGRIVGVRGYYLNADPRLRQVGQGVGGGQQQQQQQSQSPSLGSARQSESSPNPSKLASQAPAAQQDRGPLTGGTDASAISPHMSQNRSTSRGGTPIPPTPPAKDVRQGSRKNISKTSSPAPEATSPSTAQESSGEDEDDDEEEEEKVERPKGKQSHKGWRGSSSGSAQRSANSLPLREGGGESQNGKGRGPNDSGEGFSEVQL